jgi:hypothetical protein
MLYPGHPVGVGDADSDAVKAIAQRLAALGYPVVSQVGQFDPALASDVKLFQSQHGDAAGRALKTDGEVGPLTWNALFPPPPAPAPPPGAGLAGAALAVARTQVGVMEKPVGSNSGPEVDAYLKAAGLGPGNFWCMAFVYWCFDQAAQKAKAANAFPHTAGCLDAWNRVRASSPARILTAGQAAANPALVKPGMVFILDHGGGNGHTGFVVGQTGGALHTIEGNSNDSGSANGVGVFELNRRSVVESDLHGFLDFTT